MNGRMIPIAVAALLTAAAPLPLEGPPPAPEAVEWLAARVPKRARPALMVSYAEMQCLALNVYWEARGESEEGQLAVAAVTLNRVGFPGFPDTVCGVVRQGLPGGPCQFDWWCDGRSDEPTNKAAWLRAQSVALRTLAGGADPTGGALYFHQTALRPSWAVGRYANQVVIGGHVFFRLTEGEPKLAMSSRGDAGRTAPD